MNRTAPKGKIIVSGILFWYPLAGVAYQFLHYLLALRNLGFDVYYIEDGFRAVYDPSIHDLNPDPSNNIRRVLPALERFGFQDRWALTGETGQWFGMTGQEVLRHYREADALLNVTGGQVIRDDHRLIKRLIYIESDPFAAQARDAQGDPKTVQQLDAHDVLFSFGENLGADDCTVPRERPQVASYQATGLHRALERAAVRSWGKISDDYNVEEQRKGCRL